MDGWIIHIQIYITVVLVLLYNLEFIIYDFFIKIYITFSSFYVKKHRRRIEIKTKLTFDNFYLFIKGRTSLLMQFPLHSICRPKRIIN